jgi:hypothetical protein
LKRAALCPNTSIAKLRALEINPATIARLLGQIPTTVEFSASKTGLSIIVTERAKGRPSRRRVLVEDPSHFFIKLPDGRKFRIEVSEVVDGPIAGHLVGDGGEGRDGEF